VPLRPFEPASNVRITNDPLLDIVPLPEYNVTEPHVSASNAPASTPTLPPAPLLPLPNVRPNDPPRPPFDTPVPISIAPLLPLVAALELITRTPLTPDVPAPSVCRLTLPLVLFEPYPACSVNETARSRARRVAALAVVAATQCQMQHDALAAQWPRPRRP
jgi:hypothetical protein